MKKLSDNSNRLLKSCSHHFVTWNLLLKLTLKCISKMPVLCKGYSHGDLSLELEGNSNFLVSFPQEKLSSGKVK